MKTILSFLLTFLLGMSTIKAQWATQTTPANTGLIRNIYIVNPNVVWAETMGTAPAWLPTILRTIDGGNVWSAVPVNISGLNGQFAINSLEVVDANTAFIVIALNTPGNGPATRVYKTTDAGLTWVSIPNIFTTQTSWANFAQFFDANNGLIFGDNQEIYTTNNGGNTWTLVPQTNLPPGFGNGDVALDRRTVSGNTIWVPVNGMRIYKSLDKGLHWTVSNTNIPDNTPGYGDIVVGLAFQDANNGLANHGNNLSRTTDGGATWTPINQSGSFFMQGLAPITGTAGYVSYSVLNTNPGISISNDNGLTWAAIDNNAHYSAAFISNQVGWSGGNNIMYKLSSKITGASKELLSGSSFTVYPNPGAGIFNITATSEKPFTLEVYDLVGNKIKRQAGNSFGENIIDLTGEPKGIYLLHILSGEQQIIQKIVLQ